jgi:DNA polymerase-3 subunit delta
MKEVNELIKQIKKGELKTVYAFDGEEPYYIDLLCDAFEQDVLQAHEKDFNLTIFYGRDSDWSAVANECRSYPAFSQRRLVILKEAAQLKDFNMLDGYIQNPLASTVFVIAHKYKKIDGRSSILRSIKKHGVHLTFDKVRDYNLSDWILNYCTTKNIKITLANAELLGTYLGTDLQKIVNELDKVLINVEEGREITAELIEKYIGISKEYNVFAYPMAIFERNAEKSYRIANYFIANPKEGPMILVTSMLYGQFSKLYQYHYAKAMPAKDIASNLKIGQFFIKDYQKAAQFFNLSQTISAIEILHEYNLQAIGMNVAHNDNRLLKELTSKLLSI